MPRATAQVMEVGNEVQLKSCPGGWIKLRKLSYGQILARRALTSGMKVRAGQSRRDFEGEIDTLNSRVTIYDFQNCIADHNLEDESGRKLDFNNPVDINSLDSKVGQEIESLMDEQNNFEEDESLGNLPAGSSGSSEAPLTSVPTPMSDSVSS